MTIQIPLLATAANTLMSWRVWRERRRSRVRLGGAMAMLTRPDTEIWPPHSLATPRTQEESWMECYLVRSLGGVWLNNHNIPKTASEEIRHEWSLAGV